MPPRIKWLYRRHRRKLLYGLLVAGAVALLLWAVIAFAAYPVQVKGTSMMPSLQDGDWLLVSRLPLWFGGAPQRLDIVLCQYPGKRQAPYVKRVVGLPGETIAIRDGVLYVNDVPLDEPYLQQMPNYRMESYHLGEDQYFVLGDNRPRSEDSHTLGSVHRTMIWGIITCRLYPLYPIQLWK